MKPTLAITILLFLTGCSGLTEGINISYTRPIGGTGKEVTAFLGGGSAGVIVKLPTGKKVEAEK